MITNITELKKALKRGTWTGVVLYDGPSLLDGAPIVAIANRIEVSSKNDKTGAMVQTWIIPRDIDPHAATKSGDDSSVCGDCPLRPANAAKNAPRCYVKTFQAPKSTWKAYHRNRYARPGVDFDAALLPELFAGKTVRIGSYGDPAAVPVAIWRDYTKHAKAWTGYTHQWRDNDALRELVMASADSAADHANALAMGWRSFRVRLPGEKLGKAEIACPASKEAGQRTQCATCKLCQGASIAAKSIAIRDHGPAAKRA